MSEKIRKILKELKRFEEEVEYGRLSEIERRKIEDLLEELHKHKLYETMEKLSLEEMKNLEKWMKIRGCIELGPGLMITVLEGDAEIEENERIKVCPKTISSALIWRYQWGAPAKDLRLFILVPGEKRIVARLSKEEEIYL